MCGPISCSNHSPGRDASPFGVPGGLALSTDLAVDEAKAPPQPLGLDPMLLLVALVWGLNMVPSKWLLEVMTPAATLVFRFASCAAIVPLAMLSGRSRAEGQAGRPWGTMLLVGVWVGVQQLLFVYALDLTYASEASLLISIAPIWTAVIGVLMGLEVLSRSNWAGIGLASVGAGLIILSNGHPVSAAAPARLQGDLLMLLSSFLYGSFMVYSKRVMERWGALRVMSWAFVFGSLVVLPTGLGPFLAADWGSFDVKVWGSLLYSGLIAGGWGFVVWYRCIVRTTPARTAVYQYLVPVVAVASASLVLGERMSVGQVLGAVVAIAGLTLARRPVRSG